MKKPGTTTRRSGTVRCAIYTRKSSEEGLEQELNSLHAQREACEAFLNSQRHEGWVCQRAAYDDGGFSGATTDRSALQRLLADITTGRVDTIVVYKIDRLTRSLAAFSKIVESLDARGASFVSVTQQFNTPTSMGRLTLLPRGDMRLFPEPAREQISAPPDVELGEPLADGAPGLLGDLELHRSARLFLDHSRSVANYASADHVIDRQPHEIATPELAIEGQVEHREIPPASFQLQANTNGPDVLRLQWTLLADQPSLVPGCAPARGDGVFGRHRRLRCRPRPPQRRIALDRL